MLYESVSGVTWIGLLCQVTRTRHLSQQISLTALRSIQPYKEAYNPINKPKFPASHDAFGSGHMVLGGRFNGHLCVA